MVITALLLVHIDMVHREARTIILLSLSTNEAQPVIFLSVLLSTCLIELLAVWGLRSVFRPVFDVDPLVSCGHPLSLFFITRLPHRRRTPQSERLSGWVCGCFS